jgi:hypothetical protein
MPPLPKQPRPDRAQLALVNEVNFGAMGRKVQKSGLVQSGASWMPESQTKTFYLTVLFQTCNKKICISAMLVGNLGQRSTLCSRSG